MIKWLWMVTLAVILQSTLYAIELYKDFDKSTPIPLAISVGTLYIPEYQLDTIQFSTKKTWALDFNYHIGNNWIMGFGLGAFTRILEENGEHDYQATFISLRSAWFLSYSRDQWNPYIGGRIQNYIISQNRAENGLSPSNMAINPEFGVLIPIFEHSYVDISLIYQFFKLPELFHQPEDSRLKNVEDYQWVGSLKWYF